MSDDPEVKVRFQVRELTPKGIDARATCRACNQPMLRIPAARCAGLVACGDKECARTGLHEPLGCCTPRLGLSSRFREARPEILWFQCPGCAGVTSLALLILLRRGEAALEDPGFVQELYFKANPRVPPGRFRLPK